jgi:cytochrome P450
MGFWVLTRYDDVVMVLRDPRFGRDAFEPMLAAIYGDAKEPGRLPRSMLFRDPPDHTRLRDAGMAGIVDAARAHGLAGHVLAHTPRPLALSGV